jgi:hypothetical protein
MKKGIHGLALWVWNLIEIDNVIIRGLMFILASIALTGICGFVYNAITLGL